MYHTMRIVLASIGLCILLTACSKSEPVAHLRPGGTLTLAERSHLASLHPLLTNWTPNFSGAYINADATQHVYLREHGIGSTVSGSRADALIFDSDGRLVDAGILHVRFAFIKDCTLLSLSPLRFRISYSDNDSKEYACYVSHDSATNQLREEMAELAAWMQMKGMH